MQYFLEISHLRNQVYLQGLQGDKFDPHECYFFDPTEFLDEELRQQLNEKIKDSVRVYYWKWFKGQKELDDMKKRVGELECIVLNSGPGGGS